MPTIQEQVEALVAQVDAVRERKLDKNAEAKEVKALEKKIFEIRPKPATIKGKGGIQVKIRSASNAVVKLVKQVDKIREGDGTDEEKAKAIKLVEGEIRATRARGE